MKCIVKPSRKALLAASSSCALPWANSSEINRVKRSSKKDSQKSDSLSPYITIVEAAHSGDMADLSTYQTLHCAMLKARSLSQKQRLGIECLLANADRKELHRILQKHVTTLCPSVASRTKVVSGTPFFELLPLKEVPRSDGRVLVHDVGRLLSSWYKACESTQLAIRKMTNWTC